MALGLIFEAFLRAIRQLSDPRFRRVFFIGVFLALALLIGFTAAFAWFTDWLVPEDLWLPVLGEVHWVDDLLSWSAVFLLLFLSVFLMIPVASAITSMFLEDVAHAVEAKHYPQLPRAQPVSFWDGLRDTVNFLGVLLLANLIGLIVYVILFFIFPPAAPLVFWGLNGFLLGREYFMLVAMRRVGRAEAKRLRSSHSGAIWVAGTLMAIPLSVPLLNLVIPIIGAATFTHLYHGLTTPLHERGSPPRQR